MATVLIGENVPDLADVLRRLLTRAGHRTHTTVTGTATLAHARDDTPDLIIMNPSLPGIDGLDVCRQLRAGPATAHLPIIMISVRQYPAEIAAAYAAGADDYIGKPFDNHDLLQRVETLIHRTAHPDGHARTASNNTTTGREIRADKRDRNADERDDHADERDKRADEREDQIDRREEQVEDRELLDQERHRLLSERQSSARNHQQER